MIEMVAHGFAEDGKHGNITKFDIDQGHTRITKCRCFCVCIYGKITTNFMLRKQIVITY